jgi:hypothetical protein
VLCKAKKGMATNYKFGSYSVSFYWDKNRVVWNVKKVKTSILENLPKLFPDSLIVAV